jgi:hypothetical protein
MPVVGTENLRDDCPADAVLVGGNAAAGRAGARWEVPPPTGGSIGWAEGGMGT